MKPSLSCDEQVALMVGRGLIIDDESACARFLGASNYYRFSFTSRMIPATP